MNHADIVNPDAFEFPGVSNDQVADGFAFIALCQAPFECLAQPRFRERLRHEVADAVLECFEGAVGIRGDDDGIERTRSAERRVGKECVSTCGSWVSPYH